MATTVIIPVRNESKTIGNIVHAFMQHPETKGNVFVGVDAQTTDDTSEAAHGMGAYPIHVDVSGKGQVVTAAIHVISHLPGLLSQRVILCDGDYTGLTPEHVSQILEPERGLVIGIPDWPDCEAPGHVINAWPRVSGFRCLDWPMIPANAHGYLLETQINLRAIKLRVPFKYVTMEGLKSPFRWPLSARRMAELRRDREWGERNGVF